MGDTKISRRIEILPTLSKSFNWLVAAKRSDRSILKMVQKHTYNLMLLLTFLHWIIKITKLTG